MSIWKRAGFYLFGWVARVLATLWLSTCRVVEFGRGIESRYLKANPGKSLLYASWHRGLFFVIYWYRNQQAVSIASASEDGELAAQAAKRFGWITARGSSRPSRRWKVILIKVIEVDWWQMPPGDRGLFPSLASSTWPNEPAYRSFRSYGVRTDTGN